MYNPYTSSNVTHEYNPYNTHNNSYIGYNIPTTYCDTTK